MRKKVMSAVLVVAMSAGITVVTSGSAEARRMYTNGWCKKYPWTC